MPYFCRRRFGKPCKGGLVSHCVVDVPCRYPEIASKRRARLLERGVLPLSIGPFQNHYRASVAPFSLSAQCNAFPNQQGLTCNPPPLVMTPLDEAVRESRLTRRADSLPASHWPLGISPGHRTSTGTSDAWLRPSGAFTRPPCVFRPGRCRHKRGSAASRCQR